MATIDRKNNRLSLFNAIKSQFTNSNNIVLKFEEFEQLFFSTEESCVSAKPNAADKNGYIKQNNLFDILTKPNRKGKVIKTEFFDPKGNEFFSLKDKVTFVKTYACFDFDWTTKSTTKYCLGATPSNTNTDTTTTNLEDYDGAYKIDGIKYFDSANINYNKDNPNSLEIKFFENVDNTLDLNGVEKTIWDNIQKYSGIELKWVDINKKFEMYLGNTQIDGNFVFNPDKNGFKFSINLGLKKLEGTGVRKSSSTPIPDTTIEKKKDTTVPVEKKKDEIPVVRTNTLRFNNDKKTYVATKKCDDFPFTLGCSNKLIGDLNASLFNGDRKNDVYSDELQNDLDNTGNFYKNPNMEITKDLWTKLMNRKIIKESVKKVLKEYIIKK